MRQRSAIISTPDRIRTCDPGLEVKIRGFSAFVPSSFAVQDDVTILLHPTRTEAVIGGRKIVVTSKIRTLSGPLANLRQKIVEMSEEGGSRDSLSVLQQGAESHQG